MAFLMPRRTAPDLIRLSDDCCENGTPARFLPGLRAYPLVVRMFYVGGLLSGIGFLFADSDNLSGWSRDAAGVVGGGRTLGVLLIISSILAFTGQCVERYARVWGVLCSAPLFCASFAILWGAFSTYLFGPSESRPSAGMVLALSVGYFVAYVNAYLIQELRIRRLVRGYS